MNRQELNPAVTVLMPVYNGGALLQTAVGSILDQTFTDFELLVIDDGSTDGAVDKLQATLDPRLRILRQNNMGLAATLNKGLSLAKGEFVARMDCDDVAHRDRLRQQTAYLREHPNVVLVGAQIERLVGDHVVSKTNFPIRHEDIRAGLLRGVHVMSHPSVFFRTEPARSVGGYWSYGVAEDWDFFLKLIEVGRVANLDVPLLRYRFHSGGINASSMLAVRTNIALAVANASRRQNALPEYSPDDHSRSLSGWQRFRIGSEVRSLTAYRRSLSARSRTTRVWNLVVASAWWPAQAIRRVMARK